MNIGNNNIMIDLETMENNPNAAITSIGAVKFSAEGVGDTFYRVINLSSSVKSGLTMDADTIVWWMQQNDEARSIFRESGVSLLSALVDFKNWIDDVDTKVWGNGASFDNVILSNAYKAVGVDVPWSFRNDMCYRTVKNLYPSIKLERKGTHHNALDDAISQASHLIRIVNSFC